MEIIDKMNGNIIVASLTGRLDAKEAGKVEEKLDSLFSEDNKYMVINLEKMDYISSSGLRVILKILKKARKQKGDVVFASMQPYVKNVFDLAGFSRMLKIFENENEAIKNFQGGL
jgi:anti-sigma B factor antagonist